MAAQTRTAQNEPTTQAVTREATIKIKKIEHTNIAKIYGLDITKLDKALSLANKNGLMIECEECGETFSVSFTNNQSELSYAGLLINKEESAECITVTYEPTKIGVLVNAQSKLEVIANLIDDLAQSYDRAVAQIETI